MSKAVPKKEQPKLKIVEDLTDVFGDGPIKRIEKPAANKSMTEHEKPAANKTMTEQEINDHFMDDLDVSEVPDVDNNVTKTNGNAKEVKQMDDSVIEDTPKQNRQKERSDKKKSAKKEALDSSNVVA